MRLDPEQRKLIRDAIDERMEPWRRDGDRLSVDGLLAVDRAEVTLVLESADGARVSISARAAVTPMRAQDEALGVAMDAADLTLLEYLESDRSLRFPGVWEGRDLDGEPVELKVERTVPELERVADEIIEQKPKN